MYPIRLRSSQIVCERRKVHHLSDSPRQQSDESLKLKQILDIDKPIKVNVASKYVSSNIKLKDNQQKLIKVNFDSKLKTTSFKLSKGEKTLIVEWPEKSPNMIIYEK